MQRRRGLLVPLILAVLVAAPAALAPVASSAAVAAAADAAKPFRLDLADRNDFVPQVNFVQCVGASMQMMLNMIEPGRDRTASTQLRLQKLARAWSGSARPTVIFPTRQPLRPLTARRRTATPCSAGSFCPAPGARLRTR